MADLTVTAGKVGLVDPDMAEVFSGIAAAAITAGQVVAYDTGEDDDKVYVADGNDGDLDQPIGVALNAAAAGQAVAFVSRGRVEGFTVSAIANFTLLYLSDTAGAICTTADESTANAAMGRVVPLSDSNLTLCVMVDIAYNTQWS